MSDEDTEEATETAETNETPEEPGDGGSGGPSKDEKQWAMFAHLSALLNFLVPFGGIIAPIVIWQMKKDDMPLVVDQAKEYVNFQITVSIVALLLIPTIFLGFGIRLLPALCIFFVVFCIIAGLKANEGIRYRYPFTLRLIK